MELVATIAICLITPLVYRSLRKYWSCKVNCWFCQKDQRVALDQRNSFVCTSCEQYNGFDESGGYNRKVPGQYCVLARAPTKRYCTPLDVHTTRPDVVPQESRSSSNGLCVDCNQQQEIILKRIAEFEPLNEHRWEEEVEFYRYKLNKAYPLCAKCTFFAQEKMQQEKVAAKRRYFFAGGYVAELMHFITFVLATSIFISQFHFLQEDAELDLLQLPTLMLIVIPTILHFANYLVGVLFCAHLISIWTNKCRPTLPDLLLPVVAILHLTSFAIPENAS
ncbi:hypothetical protein DICVIV_11860 [Dictyocaulus viviparus]|uniref:Ima1 N-terminal domain-containing protein n=1 Tax=Dictyocaulus viviparus TaxID=29172 RepID=A0A0D8XEQ1_DICVI|nr:hypothetical protein DICVIV_11860 [Dictyocaulus viviparus]